MAFFSSFENVKKQQRWKLFEKCLTFSFNTLFSALNTQRNVFELVRIGRVSVWKLFDHLLQIGYWILCECWMGWMLWSFWILWAAIYWCSPRHRRKAKKEMEIKTLIAIKWCNRRINKPDRLLFIYILYLSIRQWKRWWRILFILKSDHNFGSNTQQMYGFLLSSAVSDYYIKNCSWTMERQMPNKNECLLIQSIHSIVVYINRFRWIHTIFKSHTMQIVFFFMRKRKKCSNFIHISHGFWRFVFYLFQLSEFIELCSQ